MNELYRSIPSTDKCVRALVKASPDLATIPAMLLKNLINSFWNKKRRDIRFGKNDDRPDLENMLEELLEFVKKGTRPLLRRVLNGSGVIVHTNLGRSVLAKEAAEAALMAASAYCSLELNLENGERGSRQALTGDLIRALTGAEDAMVVNNNAAAVLLALDTLCAGGETIVSRGELVEIGGSFRIPDIMEKSGATLREVGTTNRTHPEDYRKAINERTRAIMRVHASNFRISGFHSAVDIKELKKIALENGLPLLVDLGSGNLADFSEAGLFDEPTVQTVLAQGADLVCFSADKALGGPQAGIVAGKGRLVEQMKKNPLARALRCDKLCLAALEATLRLYLDPEKTKERVPTVRMITKKAEELARSARFLAARIKRAFAKADIACDVKLMSANSRVGGGSFPECGLPTTLVCLKPDGISADMLRSRLLKLDIPLVGRIEKDAFCLDPRTLEKTDYPLLTENLLNALKQ